MVKPATKVLVRVLAAGLAGVAAVMAAATWLIAAGPISVAFLSPYFERSLRFEDAGLHVAIGDTVLAWGGWQRNVDLRAVNVRVLDAGNNVLASAPEVSIALSGQALLRGIFAPTAIEFFHPELRFARDADGRFSFGKPQAGAGDTSGMIQALLAALSAGGQAGTPAAYLQELAITDGVLWLDDAVAGQTWHAPAVDATVQRSTEGVAVKMQAGLDVGGTSIRIGGTAAFSQAKGELQVAIDLADLNPGRLLAAAGPRPAVPVSALDYAAGLDAPVTGRVGAVIGADGAVRRFDFDITAGAGRLAIPEIWNVTQSFSQISARGSVLEGLRTIRLDDMFVAKGAAQAQGSVIVAIEPVGVGLTIDATWKSLPADQLEALWPRELAPFTRDWVTRNVHSGIVTEGGVHMHTDPGRLRDLPLRQDEIDMTFAYTGAVTTYLDGLPELRGAQGTAHMTGTTFDAVLARGTIGEMALSEGTVHIAGLDTAIPVMTVDLVASGRTAEAAKILGTPPLSLELPTGMQGTISARGRIVSPVHEGVTVHDVGYAVAANLRDFALAGMPYGLSVSAGTIAVKVDGATASGQGTLNVNGVPMNLAVQHAFASGAAAPTHTTVGATLDDAGRAALGVALGSFVTGPAVVTAAIDSVGWELRHADVAIDLVAAAVRTPVPAWDKSPRSPGNAHLVLDGRPDGAIAVPAATLTLPGLTASGTMSIDVRAGSARGEFAANGLPVRVEWHLGGDGAAGARLSLEAVLDDTMRRELGFDTSTWMTGPLAAKVDADTRGAALSGAKVTLNLKDATVTSPIWDKPAGTDGVAELTLVPDARGKLQVYSYAVSAAGLVSAGTVDLDAQGDLLRLTIARLVLGETNLTGTVTRADGNTLTVEVAGPALDLRPVFERESRPHEPETNLPGVVVRARFDRLYLTDTLVFATLSGTATWSGVWTGIDATALMADGEPVRLNLTGTSGGADAIVTTENGGELVGTLGILQGVNGGRLRADIRMIYAPDGMVAQGKAVSTAFRLERAPALARLFSLASLQGLADTLQGGGFITFTGFEAPFSYEGGTVSLDQALAKGQAIGVAVQGQFNKAKDSVNLEGTVVPLYPLNSVLGKVPILGPLIIGEGLLATDFRVTGKASEPTMTVNPISALTPGITRILSMPFFGLGGTPEPTPPTGVPPEGQRN